MKICDRKTDIPRASLPFRRTALTGLVLSLFFGTAGCTAAEKNLFMFDGARPVMQNGVPSGGAASPRSEIIYSLLSLNSAMSHDDYDAVCRCGLALASDLSAEDKQVLPSVIESVLWLLAADRHEDAGRVLSAALKRLPDQFDLLSLQADLLLKDGRGEEAVALMRRAAQKLPGNIEARFILINVLTQAGHTQEALSMMKEVPEASLTPELRFSYAQLLNIQGSYAESERQLIEALKKKEDYTEAMLLLALTQERLNKNGDALAMYEKVLRQDPDNNRCRLLLLRLCILTENTEKALEYALGSADPVKFAVSAAAVLMDEKQYAKADRFFAKMEEQEQLAEDLYFYHASLLSQHDVDAGRTIALLDRVGPHHPAYYSALRLKFTTLAGQGREVDARRVIEDALKEHPDSVECLLLAAESLAALKDYARAEACLRRILAGDPENSSALYQLAFLFELRGDRGEALRQMEGVVQKVPDNASALNFIAYSLAEMDRDLDKALTYAQKASEIEPDADYIADTLAWVRFKRGDYDEAWKNIQRALELHVRANGSDPVLIEHVGDIARAVGKTDTAAEAWNEASKLFLSQDKNADAERIRHKLSTLKK